MRTLIIAAIVAALFVAGPALADPRGLWLTEGGKSRVVLAACEHNKKRLCGTIVWMKNPRKDVKNDDESLRGRELVGTLVVRDLKYEGKGEWDDGEIYNPSDGDTYDSEMVQIDDDTLEVSGCIWFICKEQIWNRVK